MGGPIATVRYRTGCLSVVVLLTFPAIVVFAIAALSPSLVEELSETRRGAWLAGTNELVIWGINIPVALLTGYVVYETWRMVLRLRDPRMLVSDEQRIHFHPTERRDPIHWEYVEEIRHHESHLRSDLYFTSLDGRSFRLRNCDEYEAGKFAEAAEDYCSSRSVNASNQ